MKIFCVGRNYAAHATELGNETPDEPVIFLKPESALCTDKQDFHYPDFTNDLHYEAELVVQISKTGKNIAEENARGYYEEMTVGIDFTARDVQTKLKSKGLPWEKSKAFDQSALVGEWMPIPEGKNMQDIYFQLFKNGDAVQHGHTAKMIFTIDFLIAHISQYFTLETGDLFFTGTPEGVGKCHPGDQLKGMLENKKCFDLHILS